MDKLKEAFEAGMACAAAYEFGTYAVNFKEWAKEHEEEIIELHKLLMISDGHRQYKRNEL